MIYGQILQRIAQLDQRIAQERKARGRALLPGLLAERDDLVRRLNVEMQPKDAAFALAEEILKSRTASGDLCSLANFIRSRWDGRSQQSPTEK